MTPVPMFPVALKKNLKKKPHQRTQKSGRAFHVGKNIFAVCCGTEPF